MTKMYAHSDGVPAFSLKLTCPDWVVASGPGWRRTVEVTTNDMRTTVWAVEERPGDGGRKVLDAIYLGMHSVDSRRVLAARLRLTRRCIYGTTGEDLKP